MSDDERDAEERHKELVALREWKEQIDFRLNRLEAAVEAMQRHGLDPRSGPST